MLVSVNNAESEIDLIRVFRSDRNLNEGAVKSCKEFLEYSHTVVQLALFEREHDCRRMVMGRGYIGIPRNMRIISRFGGINASDPVRILNASPENSY
ncbi:hypothetical protein T265_06583 [Opisthorchis viverrini]|uniref:Uncharacterized protein n=1 Tax=Opisthorchis viverrini TaxID=6198 RepID=A0A075ADK2_OPIVI|nr:hypothetical protein T265_06583 [Opisthorchis viverrini]KER26104.1 hypothetical protein T265_06583 [Opisthorchis viverrini]